MRGVVPWALLVLAACEENPSLRVEVTHPDDVTVVTTTISVYESDLFSCEKVEFGDLSADELAAAEVDTITIGTGLPADDLTMSRVDPKVIVARGFDAEGANVTAGCEEKGVVGEGDSLPIATVLTAHVSVNGIGLEDNDPFAIVVTVTDPLVRSLPDRVVSWRVHAADGVIPLSSTNLTLGDDNDWVPSAPPCTNDSGFARLHPVPPSTIGGFATSVRTSWSVEPPRTFTTFTPVDDSDRQSIIPVANSQRWCALRVSGSTRRLVCLEDDAGTPTAFEYTVTASNGGARFAKGQGQPITGLPNGEQPIGLVSIDRGAARDVYAITNKARPIGVFGPSVPADPVAKLVVGEATDVTVLPTCGQTQAALLVNVQLALTRELRTMTIDPTKPLGQGVALLQYLSPPVSINEGLAINRTGCIAELAAGGETVLRQVGVVDITGREGPGLARNSTAGFFPCSVNDGKCAISVPVARAGVGFLPADDVHPERVVGTTFDASGFVLSVAVLQPDKLGVPRLVELERITSASFPAHIVAGHFDGDGRPDLFWDIPNVNNGSSNFQLAYAHEVGGQRLSALSATQQDELVVDTFVADVTGDGKDDLVITSIDRVLQPTLFEVRVIPGQVAIKPFTLTLDEPCASQ